MAKNQPTLQELIRRRQAGGFIGRRGELGTFEDNLRLPVDDPRRSFLFSVHGDAGIGKTFLTRQFVRLARENQCATAYVDESSHDIPGLLEAIVADLERQGLRCKNFGDRLAAYRQRRHELDADPAAPVGLSSLLTRSAVRIAVRAGHDLPGVGAVAKEFNPDVVADEAERLRAYVSRRLRDRDAVRLVLSPVVLLSQAFVTDLCTLAEQHPVALFFDTYERTGVFLESWLLDLLAGRHGNLPANLVLTIAGQRPLDVNRWGDFLTVRTDLPLRLFTDGEARQLLTERGVTSDRVADVIIELSGRLPVLVAMLAETRPEDAEAVGDPSGSAVERFLKWETDEQRRTAALRGSLPRRLNVEIFAAATDPDSPEADLGWLCGLPFVTEHADGYRYHDVVRTPMLRVLRRRNPTEWRRRNQALAEYYRAARKALNATPKDGRWHVLAVEEHYHRLCADPDAALPDALAELITATARRPQDIAQWTQPVATRTHQRWRSAASGWPDGPLARMTTWCACSPTSPEPTG